MHPEAHIHAFGSVCKYKHLNHAAVDLQTKCASRFVIITDKIQLLHESAHAKIIPVYLKGRNYGSEDFGVLLLGWCERCGRSYKEH